MSLKLLDKLPEPKLYLSQEPVSIDAKKAEDVVNEIKAAGGDAIAVAGDVGADEFPKKIVDATVKFTFDKMLHTTPDDTWDIIQKIHVKAPFRLIRQAAPYFRLKVRVLLGILPTPIVTCSITIQPEQRENRSIIMVSSTSGLHGNVGQANYSAAKAAVIGLTKTIAKEWGPFGVRANCIAFGLVHTRLTSAKEKGVTIEIDGKKVALGVPGAKEVDDPAAKSGAAYPHIPLRRGGHPDEAAAAMLL
ncbi:hypothetical protein VNI00_004870 [Paramarasmius palmivorus]|uniref:Uncharacterized protein n=1 Tax=Paramarasmius palmivorus TaxID=297713 RepID=A0AAW0DLL8_9AGAR